MAKDPSTHEVTGLLVDWRQGDRAALEQLLPLVYDELRQVARAHLRRERAGHSLQTTALVNEAYLRLVDLKRMTLHDRAHFFAMSARLMRQILIDHARRKHAARRGNAAILLSLDDASTVAAPAVVDVLDLDRALEELAGFDQRQCRIVELRFFAGLSIDATAEALDISTATVEREWVMAKAWLYQRLSARPA